MYDRDERKLYIGKSGEEKVYIYPKMANRHGMIAGATGTGKTVTLKVLAESFADAGVPVFLADVKGDLAGMCRAGVASDDMNARIERFSLESDGFDFHSYPVTFWDVYGKKGLPVRTTITEMGPLLLGRILGLNDTQTDILKVVFRIADDEGLLLIDSKDLRAMLAHVSQNAKEYSINYGNISAQSMGVITRAVMALETEGANQFFGEPALDIRDWLVRDCDGRGQISILACQTLINYPTMYSTFLLWMLSELFEILPEAGDLDKPKMVFFFDEAHMLFDSANRALLEKIEQVVKLIRSKGVGVFFITQSPKDIPNGVLAQLGTKIQHALHAYTPAEMKTIKSAADSFRSNPEFDTVQAVQELGIGEALVSVLDEEGVPTIVKRTKILPPQSQMGAISEDIRDNEITGCLLFNKYIEEIDRDSAYEFLMRKQLEDEEAKQAAIEAAQREKEEAAARKLAEKEEAAATKAAEKQAKNEAAERIKAEMAAKKAKEKEEAARKATITRATKSVASTAAGTIGREMGNAVGKSVGGSFGKKLGGNVGASLGRGLIGTLFKK